MNKIKQTDYAYLSGYLDGDGCFYIGKFLPKGRITYKFPASIIISSINNDVLQEFKCMFGGSICSKKHIIKGHKQLHSLSIKKNESKILINNIIEYLVEKKQEALLMLSFINSNSNSDRFKYINEMKILKDTGNIVSKHHKEQFKEFSNTIDPSTNDYAYLAGFIDAECCLSISKYKPKNRPNYTYKISLSLNNTKAPIFKWLLQRFGGSISFVNRIKHKKATKNQLLWRITGKALSKLLPCIYPYLKYKKPVCYELMKFYNTTLINGGDRQSEFFHDFYSRTIDIRENIVSNVHKLNLKGIK